MPKFPYGLSEIAHLQDRDPGLGAVIDRIGWIEREVTPDLFAALIHSLAAQQISNAAAATVQRRLGALLGELTPWRVAQTPLAELQACGLSFRKAAWIQHLGQHVASGALDLSALPALPDAEVIRLLSAVPGVGVWTAEMLLIFALARPDVVSWGRLRDPARPAAALQPGDPQPGAIRAVSGTLSALWHGGVVLLVGAGGIAGRDCRSRPPGPGPHLQVSVHPQSLHLIFGRALKVVFYFI